MKIKIFSDIFKAAFRREWLFLLHARRKFFYFCLLFPLAAFMVLKGAFTPPVLRDLPVAVVDNDGSHISRELIRTLDASPDIMISKSLQSPDEARRLISNATVYGLVVIPEDFSRRVLGYKGAKVYLEYNNQLFMIGGLVNKGVVAAVRDFSNRYNVEFMESQGQPFYAATAKAEPILFGDQVLFNPYLNYQYFFLLGLFPAVFQLLAVGCAVYAFLYETKYDDFRELVPLINKAPVTSVLAKTVPYYIIFSAVALLMLFFLFVYVGTPFRSGFWSVLAATFLFVSASVSGGSAIVVMFKKLSFSVTAIYAAPTFAYAGVTFPAMGMPFLARLWSEFIPLTHYHRILINEAMRGADHSSTPWDMLYLFVFSMAAFIITAAGYALAARKGKQEAPA